MARPWLAVWIALLAYAVTGHLDCREAATCQVVVVTHNEVMQ